MAEPSAMPSTGRSWRRCLARAGGDAIFAGRPSESLIGEGEWDLMLLVSYPTRQAFLDMVSSPEYQAIEHLRTDALVRSELRAMDAVDIGARAQAS